MTSHGLSDQKVRFLAQEVSRTLATRVLRALNANSTWTLVGNVSAFISQGVILIGMARLTDSACVGRFAFGLAITTPLFMLVGLQLRQVIIADVEGVFDIRDAVLLRVACIVLAVLGSGAISAGIDYSALPSVLGIAFYKAMDSFADLTLTYRQCRGQFRTASAIRMARALLMLGAALLAAIFARSAAVTGVALGVGIFLSLVLFDGAVVVSLFKPRVVKSTLPTITRMKMLLRRCVPLGFVMLMLGLFSNTPRYFIFYYLGEAPLGVYSILGTVTTAGTFIVMAGCETSLRRLSQYYIEKKIPAFYGLLRRLLIVSGSVGIAMCAFSYICGESVLRIVCGEEYAQHAGTLNLLVIAGAVGFLTSVLGCAATASQRYTAQALAVAAVTVVCAVSCQLFTPDYGLNGAAFSFLIGWSACCIAYYLMLPSRKFTC